jgi:hypothetical protein
MKKNKNQTIIIVIIIAAVLLYMGNHGMFKSIFNIGGDNINPPLTPSPDKITEYLSYSNILSINPSTICVGQSTTGSINTNIPRGVCSIYSKIGSGAWTLLSNVNLDANGDYSQSSGSITTAGTAMLNAVCCDGAGNCKVSNQVTLTVNNCYLCCLAMGVNACYENNCPPAGVRISGPYNTLPLCQASCNGETEPVICYDSDIGLSPFEEQLKFAGFCTDSSGTYSDYCYEGTDHLIEYYCEPLSSPPSERHCGYTSYNCPGMIPGSTCIDGKCVLSSGGDFGGYASCDAFRIAEGKEFYVTGAGLNNIDECEAYAQSYCSQFGSAEPHVVGGLPPGYVMLLDFSDPDCCIFNCNWSWN